jgi:hypothetical protein
LEINKNPFSSSIYKKKFLEHFVENGSAYTFDFIDGIEFYRHSIYPLYINIGKNLTKGMAYSPKKSLKTESVGNRTFLIYDVPDHIKTEKVQWPEGLRCSKVKQYLGYYIDLNAYSSIDDYLKANFTKPSRYKMRKYRRRLEECFDIQYVTYLGHIDRSRYDELFKTFHLLLRKRYTEKQIRNNNLEPKEWSFYKDVVYEMIRDKEASLFVIYDQELPIYIALNYMKENTVISAITVFDIDYSKFHVGSVAIWRQLEWCMENDKRIFDFSKGHYGYKDDWATNKYQFEQHILSNKKSLISSTIGLYLQTYYALKQNFRQKNLNIIYNKILFQLKSKYFKYRESSRGGEIISKQSWETQSKSNFVIIDRFDADHHFIKKTLNAFLYLSRENIRDVEILYNRKDKVYCFKGNEQVECIRYVNG